MAMNKILYALPALAVLGMFSVADADTVQQRIDKLQERIADLQDRIEQSTDQKKIAKWEAKIDRLQNRIAELEAKLEPAQATQKATESVAPQERTARATADDGYPPTLVFADYNRGSGVLTLEFHETVDIDSVDVREASIRSPGGHNFALTDMTVTTTADSDTVTVQLNGFWKNRVNGASPNVDEVSLDDGFADDLDGNPNVAHSHEFGVRTDPPGDTTPPSFVSATLDLNTGILTVVFDEAIDVSRITLRNWVLANTASITDTQFLGGSQLDSEADSETVTVTLSETVLDWVGDKSLRVLAPNILDPAGNIYHTPGNGEIVTVIPADTTPPAITVLGDDPLAHELGDPYMDLGATADDGSAVTTDTSDVDVNTAGDYTVTYKATDEHGNEGTATRTVQVRDTIPPTALSATLDGSTLTVAFDEAIDVSEVATEEIGLGEYTLYNSSFDDTADDSDTLVLALTQASLGTIGGLESPELDFATGSVRDVAGNKLQAVTVPMTVTNAPEETPTDDTPTEVPEPDATVTITADGRFAEDAGTIEVQLGGDMTLDVRFVNEHASDHTVLADLISWHFGHQSEDIVLPSGQSATRTFTVQEDAPRIGTDSERANVYLVFGVADIEGTPEHEPDTFRGDHAIKVRIADPAS